MPSDEPDVNRPLYRSRANLRHKNLSSSPYFFIIGIPPTPGRDRARHDARQGAVGGLWGVGGGDGGMGRDNGYDAAAGTSSSTIPVGRMIATGFRILRA